MYTPSIFLYQLTLFIIIISLVNVLSKIKLYSIAVIFITKTLLVMCIYTLQRLFLLFLVPMVIAVYLLSLVYHSFASYKI